MNKKAHRRAKKWKLPLFIGVFLTVITLLVVIMVYHPINWGSRQKIYVDPAKNEFYTNVTPVGATFKVSIKAADWVAPGVFSYQFTFQYDKTILDVVAAEIPTGHWLTPADPTQIFPVDSGTINHEQGTVSFSVTLMATELGKTGSGTIATITLKIILAPQLGKSLTCPLGIKEVMMVNPNAQQIPSADYDVVPGTFELKNMAD